MLGWMANDASTHHRMSRRSFPSNLQQKVPKHLSKKNLMMKREARPARLNRNVSHRIHKWQRQMPSESQAEQFERTNFTLFGFEHQSETGTRESVQTQSEGLISSLHKRTEPGTRSEDGRTSFMSKSDPSSSPRSPRVSQHLEFLRCYRTNYPRARTTKMPSSNEKGTVWDRKRTRTELGTNPKSSSRAR